MIVTHRDIPGVNAYNVYEEPMRRNEKQAQAGGPNPDYIPQQPHQLIPGPKQHASLHDIAIAYCNHLEERVVMFEREMAASWERENIAHNVESEQMNDVRNRNTELEIQNRELRKIIAEKGYRPQQSAAMHPWDLPCVRSPKNPEGLTANQLVDRQQARINELVDLIEQQSMARGVPAAPAGPHPWDQAVPPDQSNPLGMTAREAIQSYRDMKATLDEELRRQRDEHSRLLNQVGAMNELSMNRYVQTAGGWAFDTFGEDIYYSIPERAARLMEESVEVAQKAGISTDMQHKIVTRVNQRKRGNMDQELGGVIICWAVMVAALKLRADTIMTLALKDCYSRQEEIRFKQRAKIADGTSPMPPVSENYSSTPPAPDVVIAEGRDNLKRFVDETGQGYGAT